MNRAKQEIFDNFITIVFDGYHQSSYKREEFRLNFRSFWPRNTDSAKLLDIGVGRGEMLGLWKEMGFINIVGIDIGHEPVEFCRNHVWPNVYLVESSEAWLCEHVEEFDLITAIDVLDHLETETLVRLLQRIRCSLKPKGVFLARVTNLASPSGAVARYSDITHELGFTDNSLSQVLRLAHFSRWDFFPWREPIKSVRGRVRVLLRNFYYSWVRFLRQLEHAYNPKILTPTLVVVAQR